MFSFLARRLRVKIVAKLSLASNEVHSYIFADQTAAAQRWFASGAKWKFPLVISS
jgi:hypothetical protein